MYSMQLYYKHLAVCYTSLMFFWHIFENINLFVARVIALWIRIWSKNKYINTAKRCIASQVLPSWDFSNQEKNSQYDFQPTTKGLWVSLIAFCGNWGRGDWSWMPVPRAVCKGWWPQLLGDSIVQSQMLQRVQYEWCEAGSETLPPHTLLHSPPRAAAGEREREWGIASSLAMAWESP